MDSVCTCSAPAGMTPVSLYICLMTSFAFPALAAPGQTSGAATTLRLESTTGTVQMKNAAGEMNPDKAYELCSDAMDFTKRFVEYHAEEIRNLSISYLAHLDVTKLFEE